MLVGMPIAQGFLQRDLFVAVNVVLSRVLFSLCHHHSGFNDTRFVQQMTIWTLDSNFHGFIRFLTSTIGYCQRKDWFLFNLNSGPVRAGG